MKNLLAFAAVLSLLVAGCSQQQGPVEVTDEQNPAAGAVEQPMVALADDQLVLAEGGYATIGDLVWCDLSDDGQYDEGEPGIGGVTIHLQCAGQDGEFGTGDDYVASTATDGTGHYLFTDVPTGAACRIWVDLTTVPEGKVPGSCRTRVACSPKPGKSYLNVDFCFREAAEGCTPGYWKNHADSWGPTGLMTSQTVASVFADAGAYPELAAASLIEALAFTGGPGTDGAARNLLRAAVASLLNASHPDLVFTMSPDDVIDAVNGALASGDRDTMLALMESLDADNNLGCPLN